MGTLRSVTRPFKFTLRQLCNRHCARNLRTMLSQPAALVFCVTIGLLGVFQLALAAGAPWGRLAWGGGHERLPAAYRFGSLVSILIYAVFATIVLERAGLIAVLPSPEIARVGAWMIAGYMALGIVMNAISRSLPERFVMTPVAILLCSSAALVALGA
ncbi:MAG: hypothetical protein RIR41_926 [Pseudomonadota bacterium]